MDKIYCRNCNAEVTQDMKSCPECGASLKPTALTSKPTYTLPDQSTPIEQPKEDKTTQITYVVLGIFLTGLGFYLIILFPHYAYVVGFPSIIGMGIVYRILVYGNLGKRRKEIPNRGLTTGKLIGYLGMLIFFSTLALAAVAALFKNLLGLSFLGFGFLVGFPLMIVGAALVNEERKEKQTSKS